MGFLLQPGFDRRKLGIEVGAEAVNHRDDRERNTGRDQAVFDRGSPGFVGEKPFENAIQLDLPRGCVGLSQQLSGRVRILNGCSIPSAQFEICGHFVR